MKKFLALLLSLAMALSLAACGGNDTTTDDTTDDTTEESSSSVKIGLICIHDQNSGYDAAHIDGLTAACEALGIDASDPEQVMMRYNIPEDETCEDAAIDLAEAGCNISFSDS